MSDEMEYPPKVGGLLSLGTAKGPEAPGNEGVFPGMDEWASPEKTLKPRHEVLCYLAASGSSTGEMAKELGVTSGTVSKLLAEPLVKQKIEEIRRRYWGANIQARFQNATGKAMDVIDNIMTNQDSDPNVKPGHRLDAAKWLLEKVTGKPKQEVEIDGGNTIAQLIAALDDMKKRGQVLGDKGVEEKKEIDVTASTPKEEVRDSIDSWIDDNIPGDR